MSGSAESRSVRAGRRPRGRDDDRYPHFRGPSGPSVYGLELAGEEDAFAISRLSNTYGPVPMGSST
ncbi:hypothetical protein FQA18_15940, partial [Haloferax volcanii]